MPWANVTPVAEIDRRAHTRLASKCPSAALTGALALVVLFPRASSAEVTVRDDRDVVIHLPQVPRRIVSLLPSLTETVCALEACARLVGADRFSIWPESVSSVPKLGGIDDPQIERIVALRPDVVLVDMSSRVTARLESLGLAVMALEARNRADVHRTLIVLGKMLGSGATAERVWASIERETRAAAARVPAALRGKRVYFEVDAAPYAAGPSSFIGETLTEMGLGNAIPAELGAFPKLNPEFVVRAQPDVIIGVASAVADMPKRPGWQSLRALTRGDTCALPTPRYELIIRPGPRMGEAAQLLADCLVSIAAPALAGTKGH